MEPQYKTSRPLKIVYIADNFDADNNGTTISVRRFVDALRSFGHTVIVVSNGRPEKDKVVMGSYTKGFVAWYVKRECMVFARPDEKLIREALEGADIAHFQIPFYLECKGLSIARQMDIPCTAGFHCQPENITFFRTCFKGNRLPYRTCFSNACLRSYTEGYPMRKVRYS